MSSGKRRISSLPVQPVIRLPVPGLPAECPSCGHHGHEWPLGVYGNQVNATCPECFAIIAPVRAVQS
jgi:hypothetical protein